MPRIFNQNIDRSKSVSKQDARDKDDWIRADGQEYERLRTPPEGFSVFDSDFEEDPVGKRIIDKYGEEHYITYWDPWSTYYWVSRDANDVKTGKGRSLHRSNIAFIEN